MGRPVSPRSDTNAKANAEAASQTVAAGAPPPGGEVAKLIATIEQEKRTDEKKEETEAATQDRTMEAQPQTSSSPQQTPSITQKPIVKLPLAGVTQRREEWLKKEEEVKQKQLNPHPPPLLSPRKDREERLSARSAGTTPSPALATFLAATSGGAVTPRSSGATPSPALSTTPATTSGGAVTPRSSGAASSAAAPPVSPSSSSAASAGERLAKEWERRLGEVAELREAKERAVAELKKDKDFLRTEMERLTIALNVTRRQKEWREKEMGVVKERLSEREGTLKRREVELDIAKRQLEDRETKLRAKEAELGRLQSERREEKELWEVRERQLAERLRDHERTVEGVKEEASGRDREIEERDEDLERMRQMLMDHLHQLNATQEANQALTSQLAARSQAQELVEREKHELQEKLGEKKTKLKRLKEVVLEKEREVEETKTKLDEQDTANHTEELLEAALARGKRMELEIEEKSLRLKSLRSTLEDKNAEVEQLKRERAAAEEQAAHDLHLKERELQALQADLKVREEASRELEVRLVHAEHERELERKAEELRRQGELDAIERTIAKWMEEMRAIHLQSEDDKRNLAKATEAISSLKGETELHKRKADEAEARAKRAEEKLLAVGVDLAAARDTIERLREAEKELDARVSLLASDVEERELQLHKVKSHAEKKERNLQEKVDALASVKKDLQRAERKLKKRSKKLSQLEQQCLDKDAHAQELVQELHAAKKAVQEHEKKLREWSYEETKQSADLSKEVSKREKERRELVALLRERETAQRGLEQELQEERIRARNREEEAERKREEARGHEEKWRALKRENKALRKRAQHLKEQLEDQAILRQQQIPSIPQLLVGNSSNSDTDTDTEHTPKVPRAVATTTATADGIDDTTKSDATPLSPRSTPRAQTTTEPIVGGTLSLASPNIASSVSATLPSVSPAEKRALKRQRVIAEIVSTEATYVSILQTVVDMFLTPLRGPRNSMLPLATVESIFAGVEPLLPYHQRLLALLQEAQQKDIERRQKESSAAETTGDAAEAEQPQQGEEEQTTGDAGDEGDKPQQPKGITSVGDVFLEMGDGLMVYTQYVNHYGVALMELRKALTHYAAFGAFASSEAVMKATRNMDIASLLITPIQRIPRYRLLLKELLDSTEKETADGSGPNGDYEQINLAFNKICNIAKTVDTLAAQHEDTQKVFRRVVGAEEWHEPERVLIKQAVFTSLPSSASSVSSSKRGGGAAAPVHVYLFNDLVMEAKPIGERRLKKMIGKNKARGVDSSQQLAAVLGGASVLNKEIVRDLELDRVFDLREVEVVPLPVDTKRPERRFGFRIVSLSREGEKEQTLSVYAQREEEKTEWINAIYETKNHLLANEDEEEREKKLREAKGEVEALKEHMMKKEDLVKKIEEKLFVEIKERTDREAKLREREKELWRKNEEAEALKRELRRMEAKVDSVEREKREVEEELERRDEECEARREELADARQRYEVIERLAQERSDELVKREAELAALQDQKRREIRGALEEERKLQEEIEKLQRDKSGEREKEKMLTLVRKSEERRELLERKVESLRQSEQALTADLAALRKANEVMKREREAAQRQADEKYAGLKKTKEDEVSKLKKELNKRKDKIATLEREVEDRQKTIGVKEMEAREKENEVRELGEQLTRERDSYQALAREKTERERELAEREEQIARRKADAVRVAAEREAQTRDHRKALERLNRDLRRSEKRRKQKKREMEQYVEESEKREEELKMELGDLLGKMEGLKISIDESDELKRKAEESFLTELAQKEEARRML